MLSGDRKLARIEQVGTRRRRPTADRRLAGEEAAAAAAAFRAREDGFAEGENHDEDGEEADDGAAQQQQRQRTPGSGRRGMGASGTPNGLNPVRAGAKSCEINFVFQTLFTRRSFCSLPHQTSLLSGRGI